MSKRREERRGGTIKELRRREDCLGFNDIQSKLDKEFELNSCTRGREFTGVKKQ